MTERKQKMAETCGSGRAGTVRLVWGQSAPTGILWFTMRDGTCLINRTHTTLTRSVIGLNDELIDPSP
jgi:hypothetical protein